MIETSSAYESGSDDDDELFVIRSVNVEPMLEIVCILGVQMKFQVDSGSIQRYPNVHTKNISIACHCQ